MEVCLEIERQEFTYAQLDADEPAVFLFRGPRRLKIISRYLFSPSDPDVRDYVIRVHLDGREILRKSQSSGLLPQVSFCDDKHGEVAALRSIIIQVPTGRHELMIFADTGEGRVAARIFRETQQRSTKDTAYAPEGYDAVYHLQFASGKQSTYYHFNDQVP